jgi:membrane protein YdbS with pleckstrin-like domain
MSNNHQIRTLRRLCAIVAVLAITALMAATDHFGMTILFNRVLPCWVFCTTVVVFVAAIVGLFTPPQRLQYPTTQLFQRPPSGYD